MILTYGITYGYSEETGVSKVNFYVLYYFLINVEEMIYHENFVHR